MLSIVTLLSCDTLQAAAPAQVQPRVLTYQLPTGWTVNEGPDATSLNPPPSMRRGAYLLIDLPKVGDVSTRRMIEALPSRTLNVGTHVPHGAPVAFPSASGTGFRHTWKSPNDSVTPRWIRIYAVRLEQGSAMLLALSQQAEFNDELQDVAASLKAVPLTAQHVRQNLTSFLVAPPPPPPPPPPPGEARQTASVKRAIYRHLSDRLPGATIRKGGEQLAFNADRSFLCDRCAFEQSGRWTLETDGGRSTLILFIAGGWQIHSEVDHHPSGVMLNGELWLFVPPSEVPAKGRRTPLN